MIRRLTFILSTLSLTSAGELCADSILSVDGKTLTGVVSFADNGKVLIRPEGEEAPARELDWKEIMRVEREPSKAGKNTESDSGSQEIPSPWEARDVGQLKVAGRSQYRDEIFTLEASARAKEKAFDAFHFVYQPLGETGEIVARVAQIEDGHGDSGAGVIMRDGLDESARNVRLLLSPTKGATMRIWQQQGGSSVGDKREEVKPPYWLKLSRLNDEIVAYISPDSNEWKRIWYAEDKFEGTTYVGLVAKAGDGDSLKKAVIDNVRVGTVAAVETGSDDPWIVLVNGSSFFAPVAGGDDTALQLGGWLEGSSISMVNVSRIEFRHPPSRSLDAYEKEGRFGLLTSEEDFVEGEVKSLTSRSVEMRSVLFGIQQFAMNRQAQALVLRKQKEEGSIKASLLVKLHNGASFVATEISSTANELKISMPPQGSAPVAVPAALLKEVKRLKK